MRLTVAEFDAEKRYQGLICLLQVMLSDSLLTVDEYDALAREYAGRLMPKTGSLLSRHRLLWHFSTVQSVYCRLSSSRSAPVLAFGVRSTCLRVTATITVRHVPD